MMEDLSCNSVAFHSETPITVSDFLRNYFDTENEMQMKICSLTIKVALL
jgi:hypothetical protein